MIAKGPDRVDRTHGSKSSIAPIGAFHRIQCVLSQLDTTKLGEQKQPVEKSRQPQIFNSPGQACGIVGRYGWLARLSSREA